MNEQKVILKYIGRNILFNVPARDLTEADFKERAAEWQEQGWNEESLVGTGLYEYAVESAKAQPKAKKKEGE